MLFKNVVKCNTYGAYVFRASSCGGVFINNEVEFLAGLECWLWFLWKTLRSNENYWNSLQKTIWGIYGWILTQLCYLGFKVVIFSNLGPKKQMVQLQAPYHKLEFHCRLCVLGREIDVLTTWLILGYISHLLFIGMNCLFWLLKALLCNSYNCYIAMAHKII